MIRKCAIFALVVCFAFTAWVGLSTAFLGPFWRVLMRDDLILDFIVIQCVLFLNLMVGAYAVCRALSMRTTGTKLAAVDRGLHSGASISDELSDKLRAE
jgi:hypothetical protein